MSRSQSWMSRGALLFAACFVLAATSSSAQTTLRWQFQPGQVLNQVMEQDVKMAMKVGQQDVATSMKQTLDVAWKVEAVDAGGVATVAQEFSRIRMKMEAPGGVGFEFDSQSEGELTGIGARLAPALKALAKSKFIVKMSGRGEIQDVVVTDETVEAFRNLPGASQLGGAFSKDGLVNLVKQAAHTFPEGPVNKGESWTNKSAIEMSQIGKMESEAKLTYAGPEVVDGKPLERIDIALTINITPQEGEAVKAAIKITDQEATGYLAFDNVAGRLNHSSVVHNLTMQATFAGTTIDQKIEQTIKVRMTPAP